MTADNKPAVTLLWKTYRGVGGRVTLYVDGEEMDDDGYTGPASPAHRLAVRGRRMAENRLLARNGFNRADVTRS